MYTAKEYAAWASRANSEGKILVIDDDGQLRLESPVQTIADRNESMRQVREAEYAWIVDPLHAEKQRKEILQEWTAELEAQYRQRVQELSAKIKAENPYVISPEF